MVIGDLGRVGEAAYSVNTVNNRNQWVGGDSSRGGPCLKLLSYQGIKVGIREDGNHPAL